MEIWQGMRGVTGNPLDESLVNSLRKKDLNNSLFKWVVIFLKQDAKIKYQNLFLILNLHQVDSLKEFNLYLNKFLDQTSDAYAH